MKQINGTPHNINGDILGKITFKKKLFNRKDWILVSEKPSRIPSGYAAVVAGKSIKNTSIPYISNISDISVFNEGDVVTSNSSLTKSQHSIIPRRSNSISCRPILTSRLRLTVSFLRKITRMANCMGGNPSWFSRKLIS